MYSVFKTIPVMLIAAAGYAQPYSYQLDDAIGSADVEWSTLGKINWRPVPTSSPWSGTPFTSGLPGMAPYGDILAYTSGGVGDVDGDGVGDFAVTWYEADKDRGDPCGNHPAPWDIPNPGTDPVVNPDGTMEQVGFVRVMSGDISGGTSGTCADSDTENYDPSVSISNNHIRRIGAPIADLGDDTIHSDFWGEGNKALWAHAITSVGDINGDGRADMLLTANSNESGVAEIWSYTSLYGKTSVPADRWVRLIVIRGVTNSLIQEEFGYNTYKGPPPNFSSGNINSTRDFNDDGQPDLMISSKFFRDSSMGHLVNTDTVGDAGFRRHASPGAAWVFMLPKADVFNEIDRVSQAACDAEPNNGHGTGSDNITDILPLQMTTADYSIRIVGHQSWQAGDTPQLGGSFEDNTFPRWFASKIAPAGDIDGDGELDLVISAPNHHPNAVYDDYVTDNQSSDPNDHGPIANHHTGQIYFFLSDSLVRGYGSTKFVDLEPKYFVEPGQGTFHGTPNTCGAKLNALYHVGTRNMSANQLAFTSEDADYIIEGSNSPSYFTQPGIGVSMVAGANLNGDSADPEFAFYHPRRNRVYVLPDIEYNISTNLPKSASTRILWSTDESTWPTTPSPYAFAQLDITHIVSGGSSANEVGVRALYDGSQTINNYYPGISGMGIAGDQDGDGDCELFIHCSSVWQMGYERIATLTIDMLDTSTRAKLVAEYLPETFPFYDTRLGDYQVYAQPNGFNANASRVTPYAMEAWPVWNPTLYDPMYPLVPMFQKDDAVLGVRHFPRRITSYPSEDTTPNPLNSWITIPAYTGTTDSEGKTYDQKTLVPAGKAYLIRSEVSAP